MEEVFWCRICETNRKLSYLSRYYLGCKVCGLILRIDDLAPESPREQHPVHTCAPNLGIYDDYAIQDAMLCYQKASAYFECRDIVAVAAICLFIGCRANDVPIMLFDLSMHMHVSVHYVALLFLDVYDFLIDEIRGFRPPSIVDPVFFIHRFTVALFKDNNFNVSLTALRILAAIKSNYAGNQKRLGGLCAAAVYMAADFNRLDVLDVDNFVPAFEDILGENLVKCRKLGFSYLAHEFRSVVEEYKDLNGQYMMGNVDFLCPHNTEKFCLCHVCYDKFVKLSDYFSSGSDASTSAKKCSIVVPREDDVQVLCGGKKKLSSSINFDVLRQMFGDDVDQSTHTKCKESIDTSNAMEQGQAREENWGNELANSCDAQGVVEDSANKDDQREEVLGNKSNSARRRFGQPKRPWVRRLGLQR
ncbi:uncharacterized protein LOC141688917 [Apium graveolens]|uniref:uncharacterized protein LOC141688917 n=1 Tax=Apium graveolens TaxID=4045 RepID=UPI003D797822